MTVAINPALLTWAINRAGERKPSLYRRFPRLRDWQAGKSSPTLRQAESFAKAAYVPFGYLFLASPPIERLPLADMRTIGSRKLRTPSPDLLDVLYICEQRQAWYRDYAKDIGSDPLPFVGSAHTNDDPSIAATHIRTYFGFDTTRRSDYQHWEAAFRAITTKADEIGILVMVSGIVGTNTHRPLDPKEFRGFALTDPFAPLVFINGADAKSAQMFTLAHEIAHIWLGQSALSDTAPAAGNKAEAWCNQVAAEVLVPLAELTAILGRDDPLKAMSRLTRHFRVSTLVVLRRLLDAGLVTRRRFQIAYAAELRRHKAKASTGGGNFYATQSTRLGHRFSRAVIESTLAGKTFYRDAFQMLGVSRVSSFRELARYCGLRANAVPA